MSHVTQSDHDDISAAIRECTHLGAEYVDLYPDTRDQWCRWLVAAFLASDSAWRDCEADPVAYRGDGWEIRVHHYTTRPPA